MITRTDEENHRRPQAPRLPQPAISASAFRTRVIRWQADPERRAACGPSTGSGAAAYLRRTADQSHSATTSPENRARNWPPTGGHARVPRSPGGRYQPPDPGAKEPGTGSPGSARPDLAPLPSRYMRQNRIDGPSLSWWRAGRRQRWDIVAVSTASMGHRCGSRGPRDDNDGTSLRLAARLAGTTAERGTLRPSVVCGRVGSRHIPGIRPAGMDMSTLV